MSQKPASLILESDDDNFPLAGRIAGDNLPGLVATPTLPSARQLWHGSETLSTLYIRTEP